MSNPTELFPKTSLAAVSWLDSDNTTAIRVYTQHLNGDIRESVFNGKSWSFNEKFVIANAKPNSPIAAFKQDEDIHVYYLTAGNFINEVCWSGSSWISGPLNDANIQASPVSRLAAIPYVGNTDVDCHVFFQRPDGAVGLTKRVKNTWVLGPVVAPAAINGTGLSAITFQGTDGDTYTGIRVFYQLPGGILAEAWVYRNKEQYQQAPIKLLSGDPLTDASTNSNLSAYSVGDNPENPTHLLFFTNSSNSVSEIGYYGQRWTVEHAGQTLTRPGSGIAALRPDPDSKLRYFIQDETDQIVEWCTDDGSQQNFHKETVVPTGPVQ